MTAPAPLRASFAAYDFTMPEPYDPERAVLTVDAKVGLVARVGSGWREVKGIEVPNSSPASLYVEPGHEALRRLHDVVAAQLDTASVQQVALTGDRKRVVGNLAGISDIYDRGAIFVCRNAAWVLERPNATTSQLAREFLIEKYHGREPSAGSDQPYYVVAMRTAGALWKRRMAKLRAAAELLATAGIDVDKLRAEMDTQAGRNNIAKRAVATGTINHATAMAARHGGWNALLACIEVTYGIFRSVDAPSLLSVLTPPPTEAVIRIED